MGKPNWSRHDWGTSKPPSYGKIQRRHFQGGDSALPQAGGCEGGSQTTAQAWSLLTRQSARPGLAHTLSLGAAQDFEHISVASYF